MPTRNFEFIADPRGKIAALSFTSCARDGTPRWSVEFKVTELRNFLVSLGAELIAARDCQKSLIAARDCQKSKPNRLGKIPKAQTTELEINLPTSTLERIKKLVAAHEGDSVGQFIQEAVEVKLRDEEDVAAA